MTHSFPTRRSSDLKVKDILAIDLPIEEWTDEDGIEPEIVEERIARAADAHMEAKMAKDAPAIWRKVEKSILLDRLAHYWKEHLATLDALRPVVFLRSYAQQTPINDHKQEADRTSDMQGTSVPVRVRSMAHSTA